VFITQCSIIIISLARFIHLIGDRVNFFQPKSSYLNSSKCNTNQGMYMIISLKNQLFLKRHHRHRSWATQHINILLYKKMFKPVRFIYYYFIYLYVNLLDSRKRLWRLYARRRITDRFYNNICFNGEKPDKFS